MKQDKEHSERFGDTVVYRELLTMTENKVLGTYQMKTSILFDDLFFITIVGILTNYSILTKIVVEEVSRKRISLFYQHGLK